ncbi:LysR family transcriptional regulator [Chromobacterium sp. IIBBL 290-4]|uniref:LysR family transcriptional regulator n=1 Tax=Chromobacterium sp. IIBBL 290-4 TaxID=2953890 RepID=UPI0020B6D904|nr:LysR family transcriptional regulator [Chromobacterium sp. IIBBL 290-4]UTH75976.1 LysR substrate-binding domain-containing protein [Chromobacterium sp. IIBBL 290-4]
METIEPTSQLALTFLAVAEAGSITAAADKLGTSKSQVSKQLSRLEALLSAQLLFRSTRRLTLTEAGQAYLEYCVRLRALMRESTAALRGLSEEASGRLRLTAPPMFAGAFLAELLLAFHQRYPAIAVELDISSDAQALEQDGFDLAIRSAEELPPQLVARALFLTRDWVVASPDWLAQVGEPAAPADLATRPCVAHGRYHSGARWLFSRDGRAEEVEVEHWLQVGDYSLNERLAEMGGGFARLPDFAAKPAVKAGRLKRVLAEWETPARPVYLVFPKKTPLPAKTRALIDFIVAWFADDKEE